jgi:hypothetical protein
MGELVDFVTYKKRKKTFSSYESELDRLWTNILVWTPYSIALERQHNINWMDMFFYPDKDW